MKVAPTHGIKVVVHVGDDSVVVARDLAAHAQAHAVDAIAAMPPTYIRPGSVTAYVDTMAYVAAGAPKLPFYLYHIPSKTNVVYKANAFLSAAAARTAANASFFPTLAGIKFTDSDLEDFLFCTAVKPPAASPGAGAGRYNLLYGSDQMLMAGLAVGADGGVGTSYNWNAEVFAAVVAAVRAGDLPGARKAQLATNDLMARVVAAEAVQPDGYAWKAFFNMVSDADSGLPRLPYLPPTPALESELKRIAVQWCADNKSAAFAPVWCSKF